jgi:hypothetical protein
LSERVGQPLFGSSEVLHRDEEDGRHNEFRVR